MDNIQGTQSPKHRHKWIGIYSNFAFSFLAFPDKDCGHKQSAGGGVASFPLYPNITGVLDKIPRRHELFVDGRTQQTIKV